jgi:two-component system chemotaxis sensor kinase CheA
MTDIDFKKRLLETFRIETKEHMAAISSALIDLEKAVAGETRQAILDSVSREAHSLKGAARAVNMAGIESVSHALETVFTALKRSPDPPSAELLDLLHRAVDTIGKCLPATAADREPAGKSGTRELVASLERAASFLSSQAPPDSRKFTEKKRDAFSGQESDGRSYAAAHDTAQEYGSDGEAVNDRHGQTAPPDTVRISTGKLDALFSQAEEMLIARLAASQRSAEFSEIGAEMALWEKEWGKIRPLLRQMRKAQHAAAGTGTAGTDAARLGRLLDFFAWNHSCIRNLENKMQGVAKGAKNDLHILDSMVDNLLLDMKGAIMFPFATIFQPLPIAARDLARDRGKEVELVTEGGAVECDKRILEEIKDPILHLIRNCIDHGIETPEERKLLGKPARGAIAVRAILLDSQRIELTVSDDGAGVDIARLAEMAVKRGVASRDQAERLGKEGLLEFIFAPGFSTRPMIDDISGRGLGLAIVREKAGKLGGAVTVESTPRGGATFRMILPLTLATFRGVIVRVGEQTFILPALHLERVARIPLSAVRSVENRETVEMESEVLSFVRLADILEMPRQEKRGVEPELVRLFVLGHEGRRIAFAVDEVLGEQEVLVKGLGPQLARVRNVSGATVLGTGQVVPILHPGDLLKSAVKGAETMAGAFPDRGEADAAPRKSVLVVEDSITARTLLKNILETAGYETLSAVDGMDALDRLRSGKIDLVVSDVDMPRMNGFDLTARVRASREFADLPVVLVTSLDSREDRERGIEAGANAYIVKSSFEQSNLLEVIKRLV